MLTMTPREAVKAATARLHAAADVTMAYRIARDRKAEEYVTASREGAGAGHAHRELLAADLQLDAAIHTEQTAHYALMRVKELGK